MTEFSHYTKRGVGKNQAPDVYCRATGSRKKFPHPYCMLSIVAKINCENGE